MIRGPKKVSNQLKKYYLSNSIPYLKSSIHSFFHNFESTQVLNFAKEKCASHLKFLQVVFSIW